MKVGWHGTTKNAKKSLSYQPFDCEYETVSLFAQNGTLTLKPTSSKRGWLINPFGSYGFDPNPHWTIPAAVLPALLITILIFLDHQITGVIVNRRENKFKKGENGSSTLVRPGTIV